MVIDKDGNSVEDIENNDDYDDEGESSARDRIVQQKFRDAIQITLMSQERIDSRILEIYQEIFKG